MDFDQLETFLEVARLSSFSRAAEKRFRTQPAISAQIKAIEDEVGVKLIDRSGGKVALTAPGRAFVNYADQTLEQRRAIINTMAEIEGEPRGGISVAANEATCLHALPEVFAEYKKRYPSVNVTVNRSEHASTLESILDNSVDFGVVSMPVNDKRLNTVVIHTDELAIIISPKHPLAKLKEVLVADLARAPMILPKVGRTRESIQELFEDQKQKPIVSMEVDSSELMKRFVVANVGIGFIARSNIVEELKAGTLVVLPTPGRPIRRELALVYRKEKALSRAALAFIDITVKLKNPKVASSGR